MLRKLIWTPLLNTIKKREEYFNAKKVEIDNYKNRAHELRTDYQKQVDMIQKNFEAEIDTIIRNAYHQQRIMIEKEQKRIRELLNTYRHDLQVNFCLDRDTVQLLSEQIAEKITQCITEQKKLF